MSKIARLNNLIKHYLMWPGNRQAGGGETGYLGNGEVVAHVRRPTVIRATRLPIWAPVIMMWWPESSH